MDWMSKSSRALTDGISNSDRRQAYGRDLLADARLTRESLFNLVAWAGVSEPSCAARAGQWGGGVWEW
eukprot:scaffold6874_cov101-Isochrysis_galbana.AAC.1